ncbi:MAG: hypothetical protein AAFP87_02945 [Pseudomonadota bacterium]
MSKESKSISAPVEEELTNEPESTGLLDRLKRTNDTELEEKVERTEGVNGSTLEPIYSSRKMVCYSVTESELKQLNLANIGVASFTSLGSAMLAFWLDVFKDTTLASSVPESAQAIISYVQPIILFLGAAFWIISGVILYWRRGLILLIKEESQEQK